MGRTTGDEAATIDSLESLTRQIRAGAAVRYLLFWGHRPRPDGRVGPGCLSQWWPSPFSVAGVTYRTAEHWMMAEKARLFADPEAERQVLDARHPAEAKKAGRLVRGFDEETWERERFRIVVEGSVHKFGAHPDLRAFLVGTAGRVLVEASPMDRVWGIGLAATDEAASDPERWRGPNLLGFALMAARGRLRDAV
ncbi:MULTISPECIES: NADAR family protein [unclassified Streptomyces]|uniref:NADAR family protein n=1 Tax=unclassified Streptomyces TaxID=2593676 RepID=UPI001F04EDD7|nr:MULTISPECIES: NADAR family protein [unclassified Streptomyces]MCH0565366.1 NADAR family protein [Streptomyces sp. MUM 2J]MCH0570907.1 NADAR family protein [Streptomyces sp. MUM 136J]